MTPEDLNRTIAQWEDIATNLKRGVFTPPEELIAIAAAVRRLQEALDEAEFKNSITSARLDAWANKAMRLGHILQGHGLHLSEYAKIQLQAADDMFRAECDEVTERLKARTARPDC